MRSWFFKRKYPEEIIDKEMSKVKFNFPRKMKPKVKEKKGVALIVKNHRNLNCLSKIIRENILYMNDKCK